MSVFSEGGALKRRMSLLSLGFTSSKRLPDDDKENNDPSRPKKAKTDGEFTAANAEGAEGSNAIVEWLNSLDDREAQQLYNIMLQTGHDTKNLLPATDRAFLKGVSSRVAPKRDGDWWIRFAEHRISRLKVGNNSKTGNKEHPRWQIDVTAQGDSSYASKIKLRIKDLSWKRLLDVARGAGSGRQVKLQCHHVAYNASSKRGSVPIPLDVGSGSSISHLCDTPGCIEIPHLEVSSEHGENLVRQRCNGVLLCLVGTVITQEEPCVHARGNSVQDRISTSCRGVRMLRLDDVTKGEILRSSVSFPAGDPKNR